MEKLKVAVIREELVELTGDAIAALILNQAIYHHEATKNMDEPIEKTIEELRKNGNQQVVEELEANLRDGWFYKSANDFHKEIMISSRPTVHRRLNELVEKGYIIKGGQYLKNIKGAGDRNWWKVNIDKVRKELSKLGYALKGYPIWKNEDEKDPVHGEQPKDEPVHGEHPPVHGEHPPVHGEHQQRLLQRSLQRNKNKKDEEEYIISEIAQNTFFKSLMIFLHKKNVSKELTLRIIKECINQNLYEFRANDYVKQFDYMAKEIEYGVTYGSFERYFVNGLKDKTEQSFISKKHMEEEKRKMEERIKRAQELSSIYFNWLEA